jgi:hypothetical protein
MEKYPDKRLLYGTNPIIINIPVNDFYSDLYEML